MTNNTRPTEYAPQTLELSTEHEELVVDHRAGLRPSEQVQSKLLSVLRSGAPVPVSCLHTRREVRRAPAATA